MIHLDTLSTLVAATLVLLLGRKLVHSVSLLKKYTIPEPVAGGLLVALALLVLKKSMDIEIDFDMSLKDPLMLAFFATIGLNANLASLRAGGKVLGSVRHPLNTSDFSSFLLQAQASKAKVIGLANAGGDTINAIKQAAEFGLTKGGQKLSPLLAFVSDIDSVGLETAQGLLVAEAFYWDLNDETRAFTKRFMERTKRVPTSAQAGVYSSVTHYLKAVKAAGTTDPDAVMKVMRATPINDMFAKGGRIREDGRMVHDMYLFEVKKPSESKAKSDDYKLLATVPGNEAFQSLELSRCPLLKK